MLFPMQIGKRSTFEVEWSDLYFGEGRGGSITNPTGLPGFIVGN